MPYIYDIIDEGDLEELKKALENGANPDDVSNEDNDDMEGCTPLFFANSEQSKILIDAGANVHQVDSHNENALFYLNVMAPGDSEDKLKKANLLLEHGFFYLPYTNILLLQSLALLTLPLFFVNYFATLPRLNLPNIALLHY